MHRAGGESYTSLSLPYAYGEHRCKPSSLQALAGTGCIGLAF